MMFHSPTVNGITGWMLRTLATSSSGPTPNRVLFWNGRLIIAATGFCAALARSPWSCAPAADVSGNSAAARGQTRLVIHACPEAWPAQVPDAGTCRADWSVGCGRGHDVEPEREAVEGGDKILQPRLVALDADVASADRVGQRGLLKDDVVQRVPRQGHRRVGIAGLHGRRVVEHAVAELEQVLPIR